MVVILLAAVLVFAIILIAVREIKKPLKETASGIPKEEKKCISGPFPEEYFSESILKVPIGDCAECLNQSFAADFFIIGQDSIFIFNAENLKLNEYNIEGKLIKTSRLNFGYQLPSDARIRGFIKTNNNNLLILESAYISVFNLNGDFIFRYILPEDLPEDVPLKIEINKLSKESSSKGINFPKGLNRAVYEIDDDTYKLTQMNNGQIIVSTHLFEKTSSSGNPYIGKVLYVYLSNPDIWFLSDSKGFLASDDNLYTEQYNENKLIIQKLPLNSNNALSTIAIPRCFIIDTIKYNILFSRIIGLGNDNSIYLDSSLGNKNDHTEVSWFSGKWSSPAFS